MRTEFLAFLAAVVLLTACNQMAQQPSVTPYEQPELAPTSGTVSVNEPPSFRLVAARGELKNPLSPTSATVSAGHRNYTYFCIQCHGRYLDGDSTVGPSFPTGQLSLLATEIAKLNDEEMFLATWYGTGLNPPFEGTMTPEEVWSVIVYIRSVQANPPKEARPEGFPAGPVDSAPLSK